MNKTNKSFFFRLYAFFKSFVLIAVVVSVGGWVAACSGQHNGSNSNVGVNSETLPEAEVSKQTGEEGRRIIVGIDDKTPPMSFWNLSTNTLMGYDIDLAKEVFKRANIDYEFRSIVWAEKEDNLLKDKSIDMIWSSLTITDERRGMFGVSVPYIKNRQAIVVSDKSAIKTKADIAGKTVAVNAGGAASRLLRSMPASEAPARIVESESKVAMISAVLAGEVDAAVGDSLLIEYYHANTPGKFRILSEAIQNEEFGVAMRPSDTELIEKINKAMQEVRDDGTQQAIYDKYFK